MHEHSGDGSITRVRGCNRSSGYCSRYTQELVPGPPLGASCSHAMLARMVPVCRTLLALLLALAQPAGCNGKVINFLAAGATPGSDPSSTDVAFHNTAVLNASLAALDAFDTLLIPNMTWVRRTHWPLATGHCA